MKRVIIIIIYFLLFWIILPFVLYKPGSISDNHIFTVAAHRNYLDPFLISCALPWPLRFISTIEMFRTKFKRKIFTALGAIPEKRYAPDNRSILFMKKALDLGYPVGVFPSGERSWTGIIQSFKPGTIQMFRRFRHIPVLPVRIEGYYFLWPRWSPCMLKSKTMIYYTGPLKKRF